MKKIYKNLTITELNEKNKTLVEKNKEQEDIINDLRNH